MSLIQWTDAFSVGDSLIDSQHKRLVELVNSLHTAMGRREGAAAAPRMVSELKKYAQEHFTDEERAMELAGYPNLHVHRAEHDKFIERVLDYELEMEEGETFIATNMSRFLLHWLENHILGSDKRYAPYLGE